MKLQDLLAKMDQLNASTKSNQSGPDDRFWKASQDESGNGYARIRFLPNKNEEELPFAKTYSHGFQNDEGRWFIEDCATTIGEECHICKENSKLWNSGIDADKEIARARKRKLKFISNILVIEDPKNRENEGKVFLFSYGQKIFEKIMDKMRPAFQDEAPVNPFDLENGADLKLKIRKVAGYTNYDKSEFASQTEVEVDKDDLVDLTEFTAKSKFKSYEEVAAKFNKFIGLANQTPVTKSAKVPEYSTTEEDEEDEKPKVSTIKKVTPAAVTKPTTSTKKVSTDDDDDDLNYFKNLANELDS